MRTQNLAQRLVHEVGRRVISARGGAPSMIHVELDAVADLERALLDAAQMHEHVAELLLRIGDAEQRALRALDHALIAHLAAGLSVERRLVEHERGLIPGLEAFHLRAILDDRAHFAFGGLRAVAEEVGGAGALLDLEPHGFGGRLARAAPGLARLRLLLLHRRLEAGGIDGDAARLQRVLRQIERKAVGVVQAEGGLAREHLPFLQAGARFRQQAQALFQRLAEAGFFQLQGFGNQRLRTHQFLVALAHLLHQRRHQPVHQRLLGAQQVRVAHGAAHDPAQHVAATDVGGQHSFGDQEARRTQVVGDHAMGRQVLAFGRYAGGGNGGGDQRPEQVDVVDRVHALQDGRHALQPHSGIDGGPRQLDPVAGAALLVLHKNEVPEFQETVAILVRAARRPARHLVTLIDEDFRARATGAGVARRPEIVGGRDADDPVVGEAGHLLPEPIGLLVVVIDGDQQVLGIERKVLGDQLPCQRDRPLLEVVAEGEVAEHLEEGVMPVGVADVVEVVVLAAGAHALLRGRGAGVGACLLAGKHVLERHHAGGREHQGGIVARHHRRRGHDLVSVLPEKIEKRGSNLIE